MPAVCVAVKADTLTEVNGFDERLHYAQVEDQVMFTLVSNRGPVHFVDEILA